MKYLLLLSCLISLNAFAQVDEREKIRQLEQQREFEKNRKISQILDSGVFYMDREDYEKADAKFRLALSSVRSVPSDLVFFFGKNSYLLGKNKQSIDWLTKYIQLKGTTGQYSEEASEWLKQAEAGLLKEQQIASKKAGEILTIDYDIDCGPTGKVTCPVCRGNTVIIKLDYLQGETYRTCPYCNKHGYLTCEEYNKLIRGQLKPSHP